VDFHAELFFFWLADAEARKGTCDFIRAVTPSATPGGHGFVSENPERSDSHLVFDHPMKLWVSNEHEENLLSLRFAALRAYGSVELA